MENVRKRLLYLHKLFFLMKSRVYITSCNIYEHNTYIYGDWKIIENTILGTQKRIPYENLGFVLHFVIFANVIYCIFTGTGK